MSYREVYDGWLRDPESFWIQAAAAVEWEKKPSKALFDEGAPIYEWFIDGRMNTCWNAVDRHVAAGFGEQIAIIHDSPVTGTTARITYAELRERVARLAGALAQRGVAAGDRVAIYMPMVPEALIAMLACVRLGAIHSVIFGGFASRELAVRIDDARPKAVIAGSCGIEPGRVVAYKPLLDEALASARHKPDLCIIFQRQTLRAELTPGRDIDWQEAVADAKEVECVPVAGNHPAYILYTSGTTGRPKGVVRPTAGHVVSLNWTMPNLYGIAPGEVFWTASDVGWVVGHSYICYAPLFNRNTTVVYEGKPVGTPDAGAFWRVIAEHEVCSFFTAPTAFRAVKRADPSGDLVRDYDLSGLRTVFLAGERADPATIKWAEKQLHKPVIDHWWQTELGYPAVMNPIGIEHLPVKPGSPSVPVPGYRMVILDPKGREMPPGELGSIASHLPLPPGTFNTLWQDEDRFRSSYLKNFPGYYETGDAGYADEDGYLFVMARTDDVINVAGHRLSTGAMEEVIAHHPDVAECAVVGAADDLKGQVPLGFVCLNAGVNRDHADITAECVALVRNQIGPVAAFKKAVVVERLPKTRSGKTLRATMAAIADGKQAQPPATIEDPAVLDEIRAALVASRHIAA